MRTLLRAPLALVLLSAAISLAPGPARAGATGEPPIIEGTVTDADGDPLAGIRVRMHNVTDEESCAPEGETDCWVELAVTTDARGRYQAEIGPGDLVTLSVTAAGYASEVARDRGPGVVDFSLTDGEPGFAPVTVSGVVRDPDGQPLGGVAVVARESRNRAALAAVQTDSIGRYLFTFDPLELDYFTLPVVVGVQLDGLPDPYGERPVGDVAIGRYYQPGTAYDEVDIGDVPVRSGPPASGQAAARPGRPRVIAARALSPRRALVRLVARGDGGSAISRFEAECGGHGRVRRAAGPAPRIAVGHLQPGRRQRCRVRARNAVGWSAFSAYSAWFRTPAQRR